MLHARTLVKCANVAVLVMGAVAILGGGGLEGCSSTSSPASSENDASGSSSGGDSSVGVGYAAFSDSGPTGPSTIFTGGGPVDLPEDAGSCVGAACNGLVITDAPVVQETRVPGSPPALTGGTLADGTYYLTSVVIYGADAGSSAVSDALVSEDGSSESGDEASVDGAASDGTSPDGASVDGSITDGAGGDGASPDGGASIGTPNGSFVEEVFYVSAGATIAQLASANGSGCTLGSVHLSTSGSVLTMAPFCGDPFTPTAPTGMTWQYTATATTITASVPLGGGETALLTLTLQ